MNQPLTNEEKIKSFLLLHGITTPVTIDPEAEEVLLMGFQSEDLERVYLDHEGALVFEFKEPDNNTLRH
jgi:hypothetical protein